MKAPRFWRRKGVVSALLLPAAALYRAAARARVKKMEAKALPVPVICVGNLTVGGAGKTPTVMALLDYLQARGVAAYCISRGYGGSLYGPVRVEPESHSAAEVGDEPLLIARHAPCWVGKRRLSVATAAVLDGAKVIVMDDGLQNPTIRKDLTLLVVDGGYGFGNGRVLPAGPLREALAEGLAKVDAAVLVGEDMTGALHLLPSSLPVLRAYLAPSGEVGVYRGKKLLAFAGIGRPEKFFATLRALGAELVEAVSFGDHHPYKEEELEKLKRRAEAKQAVLITTEKDAVRLPPAFREHVQTLPVQLRFAEDAALETLLAEMLAKAAAGR